MIVTFALIKGNFILKDTYIKYRIILYRSYLMFIFVLNCEYNLELVAKFDINLQYLIIYNKHGLIFNDINEFI